MADASQIQLFQTGDGEVQLDVALEEETVWLSQAQMVGLFGRDKSLISKNICNVFKEKELDKKATVAKLATVQKEGGRDVSRDVEHCNLDVIISVGYRVKSQLKLDFKPKSHCKKCSLCHFNVELFVI